MSALPGNRTGFKRAVPATLAVFFCLLLSIPGISRGAISEGFDNFDTGVRPAGWTFHNCNSDFDSYTSAGDFGAASPSIKLDLTADYIQTETLFHPDQLGFWLRGKATDSTSYLLVEEYYTTWTELTRIQPLPASGTDIGSLSMNFFATIARFTFNQSTGDLAFDDVSISDADPTATPTISPVPTATPQPTATPTIAPTTTPSATPYTNFPNPSFELEPPLVHWTPVTSAASQVDRSNLFAYDGSYSCALMDPNKNDYDKRGIMSTAVAVVPGEDYDFSGWFYTDTDGGTGTVDENIFRFQIQWMNETEVVYYDTDEGWSNTSFGSWMKKEYKSMTAPANANFVRIYLAVTETAVNDNDSYIDLFSVAHSPTITVTSPTAGDAWYINESHNITWDSVSITGNLDIDYSTNGGPWAPIAANIPDTGSVAWTIPTDPSTQALVRVRETGGGGVADQSGLFTIAERDSINVLSPHGGEIWYRSVAYDIEWSYGPDVGAGNVDLSYSINSGSSWITITSGIALGSSPYSWTVPQENSANCLVRVQQTAGASGQSPNVFTISSPTFNVTSPAGGEYWYWNDPHTITWTSTSGVTGNVNIDYSTNGLSGPWAPIASNHADSGFCSWTIPNDPSETAWVRLSEVGGISLPGYSASDFNIVGVSPPSPYYALQWGVMTEVETECSIYSIEAYDNDNIWLGCGCGLIYYYDGLEWILQRHSKSNIREFVALTSDNVYGGGTGGYVYHYDGSYWWLADSGLEKTIYSIDAPDEDHVIAGAASGKVLYYDSDFGSWNDSSAASSGSLYGCVYLKPNLAYLMKKGSSTTNTETYVSTDGGQTWNYQEEFSSWGLGNHPLGGCLSQTGEALLWAAGDCGEIHHYDGTSWCLQTRVGWTNFECVEVLDENNVWVGGKSVLHYNGSRWIVEIPESDTKIPTIYQISAVDNRHVYAIGSSGSKKIYTTFPLPTTTPTPWAYKTVTPTPIPTITPKDYKTPTPTPLPMICNYSFEESPDLTCWTIEGTESSIEKSSFYAYDGSYSCLFERPTTSYTGRGVRSANGVVTAGRSYDFSGYFYVELNDGDIADTNFQFLIEWRDSVGEIIQTDGSDGWSISDFGAWERKEYSRQLAPPGAVSVSIYLACEEDVNNDNNTYIDYFNVNPLPPPTPTPYNFQTPSPTPLPVAGPISGWVYDRVTGQGIANLHVSAIPTEAGSGHGGTLTNSSGNYTISPLIAGTYLVYTDSYDHGIRVYRSQWYNQKDSMDSAIEVSSNSYGIDFPLYKQGVPPTPTPGPTPVYQAITVAGGDYNGDGFSDITIFRESSGLWAVRGITRLYFGVSGDIPVSGDYDGDGTADFALYRGSNGLWAARNVTRIYFGDSTDQPVPGDYDGDGSCDAGIFRESNGLWAVRGMTRAYFGVSADQPVPGDYDGDGAVDIALFRSSNALWALRGLSRIYFGNYSDRPLPGNYYGAGIFRPAVFRPSSSLWAIRGLTRVYFGSAYDQPAPAAYNGVYGIGLFRGETGLWSIRGRTRAYFGTEGDLPATR